MTSILELSPAAFNELNESYKWYEEKSVGLGARFISYVDDRLNTIKEHPDRFPKRKGKYHEAVIHIFPYIIIYEVLKSERIILVLHIFHSSRNPRLKYKR